MSDNTSYPRMVRIRQQFPAEQVEDIPSEVESQLSRLQLGEKVRAGETVAITVGSRGIANIAVITKGIVDHIKALGATPFLVPAMGSHGGGTAAGQRGILEGYGVTEEAMGAEIRASMETVIVETTPQGIPVHFDKHASLADHVIVAGRVKPHTGFVGEIESGLHKMMLIGLGKHEGAKIYHRAIRDFSFIEIIRAVADVVIKRCKVVAGVAIVENAYDETGRIEAVAPEQFFDRERELLTLAKQWLPRLPITPVDLLIIDRIGKDISGTGLDTNVVGRKFIHHEASDRDEVNCKRIFVRGLTQKSKGNATGIGLAEFTTKRAVDQIDFDITRTNCITGGHPEGAMIPIAYESDRDAIAAAISTVGMVEVADSRIVQIADTLHLAELLVSESCMKELEGNDHIEIIDGPHAMAFDANGNIADV
ncbi:MAG: DUF2088 domain-containing protein [Planctomycetaceae bacterium]|nr:DUF2088 domain-containing protein [Planctomycetaceae bacterium]